MSSKVVSEKQRIAEERKEWQAEIKRIDFQYISQGRLFVPRGRVLVHNQIKPPIYGNGFRIWTQKPDKKLVRCDCSWVPHYRIKDEVLARRDTRP